MLAYTKSGIYKYDLLTDEAQKPNRLERLMGSSEKMYVVKLAIPDLPSPISVRVFFPKNSSLGNIYPGSGAGGIPGLSRGADVSPQPKTALDEKSWAALNSLLSDRIDSIPSEFSRKRDRMTYADGIIATPAKELAALKACEKISALGSAIERAKTNLPISVNSKSNANPTAR